MKKSQNWQHQLNTIDFLIPRKSSGYFPQLVAEIGLSKRLEDKVNAANSQLGCSSAGKKYQVSRDDEHELATEVLLCRHTFTCLLLKKQLFRQAALSVIQNIYLTRERKIFFTHQASGTEQERQHALLLFSQNGPGSTIPLSHTLQHQILARIWYRILYKSNKKDLERDKNFVELNNTVVRLNTLRNVYVLLAGGLISSVARSAAATYKKTITIEDAQQIGSFGVARAAYRYHHSSGARFSTYASYWIKRELQVQALQGRMIRVSPSLLERISLYSRNQDEEKEKEAVNTLLSTQVTLDDNVHLRQGAMQTQQYGPGELLEKKEATEILLASVNKVLSGKSRDIIKRKYGLDEYQGNPQSAIAIGNFYGVTRGSIYQLEQKALQKLQRHLTKTNTGL